jgi:hypothetical protein
MRALPVTSSACPALCASTTPLSQLFQPDILWISSRTSSRLRGLLLCRAMMALHGDYPAARWKKAATFFQCAL